MAKKAAHHKKEMHHKEEHHKKAMHGHKMATSAHHKKKK
jgi:hypothetical protein